MRRSERQRPRDTLPPSDAWISFLRGYGPVNRVGSMFAETIQERADDYGVEPLHFEHPKLSTLIEALDPAAGRMTNIVLTGTAGDGKTSLLNEVWSRLGGDDRRATGTNRDDMLELLVDVAGRECRVLFIFEFSGFAPSKGEEWSDEKLNLMERFVRAVEQPTNEFFIIAANDGKLVQAWDSLPEGSSAKAFSAVIEDLLAADRQTTADHDILFLNLSRMRTAEILGHALECLLARREWRCFQDEAEDAAYSPASPLWRNFQILSDERFKERLLALADLCDMNGLHVSIREILLLLVNALLGHAASGEHLMQPDEIRALSSTSRAYEAAIYGNLFGANLPPAKQDQYAVFRHLGTFRLGLETTNLFDNLLIFGVEDEAFIEDHGRLLADDPLYGYNPHFERLRHSYVDAEEDRTATDAFVESLANERRRLFFRLDEGDPRLDPWRLTVFQAADSYRRRVLAPGRQGRPVESIVIKTLVCGLNRIWTGMLVGDLDRLYLSTGLDFSSAPISDIYLYDVKLQSTLHGDRIEVEFREGLPVLRVSLGRDGRGADFPLHLVRFEFLTRVAGGALPNSFSKECNEDVLAFKSRLLSEYHKLRRESGEPSAQLSVLSQGERGSLSQDYLSLPL